MMPVVYAEQLQTGNSPTGPGTQEPGHLRARDIRRICALTLVASDVDPESVCRPLGIARVP